jgi:hypothetical protein
METQTISDSREANHGRWLYIFPSWPVISSACRMDCTHHHLAGKEGRHAFN